MPRGVYIRTPKARANIAAAARRAWSVPDSVFNTEEYRAKLSVAQKARGATPPNRTGLRNSPEHVEKVRRVHVGKAVSVETRAKLSVATANQRRRQHKVSKIEYEVAPQLEARGFVHNADRAVKVVGPDGFCKIPDFVNLDQSCVVEVWGDYWHRGEDPAVLIAWYEAVGWDCEVIWEHEIKAARR